MEPALLGLVLDSSVLVAAERGQLTTPEAIRRIREAVGDIPIVICALTVAVIGACALELGYAVGTSNLRDFERIPGLTVVRL
jgi:predicted nucleic acid-binding protein